METVKICMNNHTKYTVGCVSCCILHKTFEIIDGTKLKEFDVPFEYKEKEEKKTIPYLNHEDSIGE